MIGLRQNNFTPHCLLVTLLFLWAWDWHYHSTTSSTFRVQWRRP